MPPDSSPPFSRGSPVGFAKPVASADVQPQLFDAESLDGDAVREQLLHHGYLALRCGSSGPFDDLETKSAALFSQPTATKAMYDSLASMAVDDPRRNSEQARLGNFISSDIGFSLPLWCTGYASLTEREQFHIIADPYVKLSTHAFRRLFWYVF